MSVLYSILVRLYRILVNQAHDICPRYMSQIFLKSTLNRSIFFDSFCLKLEKERYTISKWSEVLEPYLG